MYSSSFLDPLFTLTKLLPPSSSLVSSPLFGTTGKGREALDNFNSLRERQAGKCKILLLRWEKPTLSYIKERLRGVQWTRKCNTPWICFTCILLGWKKLFLAGKMNEDMKSSTWKSMQNTENVFLGQENPTPEKYENRNPFTKSLPLCGPVTVQALFFFCPLLPSQRIRALWLQGKGYFPPKTSHNHHYDQH